MSTTEINDQLQVRRDKMEDLRQNGIDPFGQRFDRTHLSSQLVEEFGEFSKEELEEIRERQTKSKERLGIYGRYAKDRNLSKEETIERINKRKSF